MDAIRINPKDLEEVRKTLRFLRGEETTKALMRSLNKTVIGVKTDASVEIRKSVAAKKTVVDKTFKTPKASINSLKASFICTGRPLPLINYNVKQTNTGVLVQVKKNRPLKIIPKAFIATVRTAKQKELGYAGHKGVFWRKWHEKKTLSKKGRFFAAGTLPAKYRLPIEQLFGPRISDIISNKPIIDKIQKKACERLIKNTEREVDFLLSKAK
ncbi:MAG: hypothetical protein KKC46_13640 [Proteobacteria bacterium]|nr:hypothetical protein [Pseudomonadota bacterium]